MKRTETVVIGAGQAGLAMSRHLTDEGREHVVLERGRLAERWRSERWDSLRLLTPNWMNRLPHWRYAGPDPDGYMTSAELAGYFQDYATSFGAPVEEGTTVREVAASASGFRVETDRGRSTGGAGLGQAIARRAVELQWGTIRAVNAHPGLRVTIVLQDRKHDFRFST